MIRTCRPFFNYKYIFVILLGIIAGSVSSLLVNSTDLGYLYLSMIEKNGFLKLSFYFFVPFLLILCSCYFNGFSLLCGFIRYIIILFLGMEIGTITTVLILMGGNAVIYSICIFLPTSFLYVIISFKAVREGENMWKKVYNSFFSDEYIPKKEETVKKYLLKFALLLLFSVIFALIISLINKSFYGLFKFVL